MTLYKCAAHIDEHNRITGGKAGDQTGREVSVTVYSNYSPGGYNGVLRYTGAKAVTVRNRMMKAAVKLANGNKVGYDQNTRASLYYEMEHVKWFLNKCNSIHKCNTDCSAFIAVVANIGMLPKHVGKPIPNYTWTGVMYDVFTAAGFKWITKGINFDTGEGLIPGDILLNIENHTSLFLGNNPNGQLYGSSKSQEKPKLTLKQVAEKVMKGEFGNGDERVAALKAAGYDPVAVQSLVNKMWR